MKIRFASVKDSAELLNIYSQYIDTPITFEHKLPSLQEFSKRISDISAIYPYLILEDDEEIIGYAYANRHMQREAYGWNAVLSIYLSSSSTSKGMGKKLYSTLIDILKLQGIINVYAGVTVPNLKSEKLHSSLGFKVIGTYHNTGFKCGKWHDVVWFEKSISNYEQLPSPIKQVCALSKEEVHAILAKYI